jgi:hypothetical protein
MTEDQLQVAVIDLCRRLKLLVHHNFDSRRSIGKGFPDIVAVGPGGQVWRELKNSVLAPTPEQMQWLGVLDQGGADAGLWRPEHWHNGEIQTTLQRLAKPRPSTTEATS